VLARARWTARAPLLGIVTYLAAGWSVLAAVGLVGVTPAWASPGRSVAGLPVILAVLQLPAILGHPDQRAPAPVQIHTGDLPPGVIFGHKGLLAWRRRMLATSTIRQKRRPASSWHQVVNTTCPSAWLMAGPAAM
jgi:hypothetical protein